MRLLGSAVIVLALLRPVSAYAQTVTQTDLRGAWLGSSVDGTNPTGKTDLLFIFQSDSLYGAITNVYTGKEKQQDFNRYKLRGDTVVLDVNLSRRDTLTGRDTVVKVSHRYGTVTLKPADRQLVFTSLAEGFGRGGIKFLLTRRDSPTPKP